LVLEWKYNNSSLIIGDELYSGVGEVHEAYSATGKIHLRQQEENQKENAI